jgi:hypothetical protein
MSDFKMIIRNKHKQVLKQFIRYLRQRLIRIKKDIKDESLSSNPTEFICKECENDVGFESELFSGGYCGYCHCKFWAKEEERINARYYTHRSKKIIISLVNDSSPTL